MMCTTVLHEGVCHRTSTPHKTGNKMKEKKKKKACERCLVDQKLFIEKNDFKVFKDFDAE